MTLIRISLMLALGAALAACDQIPLNKQSGQPEAQKTAAVTDTSPVLATVNGSPITEHMLDMYSKQRQARRPQGAGADRKAALEEFINLELARQDGVSKGLNRQSEVAAQIEQQTRAVIASAAIQEELKAHPVSDADLKKMYDDKTAGAGKEFKARHILVEDEAKAKQLIAELDKGADFSELAKKASTGPSGKNGGDLGWFSPQQMVKPFSDAVAGLEKGAYTKTPVKTQFGWHVIILDDTREVTPPPFDQVKGQLQALVQNQRIQGYIRQLRQQADIQIKMDEADAKDATTSP